MIIKRTDMDKMFSQTVARYMADGMWINTESMSGSQGEVGKIDLTDGVNVYRVLFTNSLDWTTDFGAYKSMIQVRKYEVTEHTLWNQDGEVVEVVLESWELGNNGAFTTDFNEACKSFEKRIARYRVKGNSTEVSFNADKIAEVVRKTGKYGYKKVKAEDITKVSKHFNSSGRVYYRIGVTGKSVIDIGC